MRETLKQTWQLTEESTRKRFLLVVKAGVNALVVGSGAMESEV